MYKKVLKFKITGAKLIIISNRKFNAVTGYNTYRVLKMSLKEGQYVEKNRDGHHCWNSTNGSSNFLFCYILCLYPIR
ncbi:hypothetical protein EMIT0210MI2_13331 [Priestia megaterium]